MARSSFGNTTSDWLLKPYRLGSSTLVALREGNTVLTFYSAKTAGSQYTDLLDPDGNPTDRISVDGHIVPRFQGPDGIVGMWADKGDGSEREFMEAQDLAGAAAAVAAAEAARDAAIAAAEYNVQGHGATGNGTTDDTSAIQTAINTGNRRIYLPPGTYVTSGITLGHNQSLVGAGVGLTTIKLKGGSNGTLLSLIDAYDSLVTNLTLDGNKAGNTSTTSSVLLIDTTPSNLNSSYHLTVDRILVKNGANNGISIPGNLGGAGSWYNWVFQLSNIDIESCNGYGMYDESSDNRFSNFYFTQNSKADLYLFGASSNQYVNFKVGEGGLTHVTAPPTKTDGACVILDTVTRCAFTNFDIQSGFWDGFYAKDSTYLTLNGVDSQNNDNYGFYFQNCKGIVGTVSTSQTVAFFNAAGDFYIDATCQNIDLRCNPAVATGAPALTVYNLGTNCTIRTSAADVVTGSMTNVLANSNFTSTTSWQANNKTATGEVFTWRANVQNDSMFGFFTGVVYHRYYLRALVQATSSSVSLGLAPNPGSSYFPVKSHSGGGSYEVLSGVTAMRSPMAASAAFAILDARASGWDNINVRYAVCIDLTTAFGTGKEPAAAEMDALLDSFSYSWFSGTGSIQDARWASTTQLTSARRHSREAAAAPTTGTWAVGDVVWNSAPAASGTIGWVCVTAGTPGTWKTFGAISA